MADFDLNPVPAKQKVDQASGIVPDLPMWQVVEHGFALANGLGQHLSGVDWRELVEGEVGYGRPEF